MGKNVAKEILGQAVMRAYEEMGATADEILVEMEHREAFCDRVAQLMETPSEPDMLRSLLSMRKQGKLPRKLRRKRR